jgi:hypothetical protein
MPKSFLVFSLIAGLYAAALAQIVAPFPRSPNIRIEQPSIDISTLISPLPFRSYHLPEFFPWFTCSFGDALECASLDSAGNGAVNCGRVRLGGNPAHATDCALKAFSKKKPFRVRYDEQGFDSEAAISFVGNTDGRVIEIDWSRDSWLRSDIGAVERRPCIQPTLLKAGSDGRVKCSPLFARLYREFFPETPAKEIKPKPKHVEY